MPGDCHRCYRQCLMGTPFLHESLTRSLLEEMASGVYVEGQLFLSVRRIRRLWGVSDPTVISSLRTLTQAGLLQPEPRRGYMLCHDFQQKAQVMLRKNRIPPLKPPQTLLQKLRLMQKERGGRIAVLLEGTLAEEEEQNVGAVSSTSELAKAAAAFEKAGRQYGFECERIIYQGVEGVDEVRAKVAAGNYQGALVYCRWGHQMLRRMLDPLLKKHLPIVVIFDDCSGLPVNSINVNNVGLGYDAIRQLYRMGHRKIAVLVRSKPAKVHQARLEGCLLVQAEQQRKDLDLQVIRVSPDKRLSPQARRYFAHPSTRPTAVFCIQSRLLSVVAPEWEALGLKVPDDISVLMASSRTSRVLDLPLDSMQLKVGAKIGRMAARLLYRIQAGDPLEKSVLVNVKYVARGSVRKLGAGESAGRGKRRVRRRARRRAAGAQSVYNQIESGNTQNAKNQ